MNKIYEDDLIDCIQIARYQLGSDSFSVFKTKKRSKNSSFKMFKTANQKQIGMK